MKINFPTTRVCFEGSPKVVVDGRELPAIAYTSYLPELKYYEDIAKQGVRLFCFPAYLAHRGINIHSGIGPFRKGIWKDDDVFDFSDIEGDFDMILAASDDAAVIIRLHLDVPQWWEEKYPEHCCIQDDGTPIRQSFTSTKWVEDMGRVLKEIIGWLNASPYAKHLAGIQVAAGGTEEWCYHYFDRFEDNSADRVAAFRKWMSETYGQDCSDAVPADINPDAEFDKHMQDTLRFHASELADRICQLSKVVKQESQGHLLTGAFYGYHNFIFDPRKGHNALGRLLKCPDLDYLASPNAYDRQPGLDWPPMAAVDSVRLHGKLWMAENDTRTFLVKPLKEYAPDICPEGAYEGGVWEGPESKHVCQMLLRNNAARMLTCQYGGWWFSMWGGWFSDPDLLAEIRLCQELASRPAVESSLCPKPEVCVVTDEDILFRDESLGGKTGQLLNQRQSLAKTGSPYRMYLRSDLDRIADQGFKFVWLLGCLDLTQEELKVVDRLQRCGCGVLHTDFEESRFLSPSSEAWEGMNVVMDWPRELLVKLYKQCDVHQYIQSADIVYVGNGFLAIHACTAGCKSISLPGRYTVTDAVSHEVLFREADSFSLEMAQYDTRLLMLQ